MITRQLLATYATTVENTTIDALLTYDKGGYRSPRGYYLTVEPVTLIERHGIFSETFMIATTKRHTVCIEETSRYSAVRFQELAQLYSTSAYATAVSIAQKNNYTLTGK